MRVDVCLFATLGKHLPPGTPGDRITLDMPDQTTVGQVVALLCIPDDLDCLRVVNGHDAGLEQVLKEGDVVSVFPPLAGGE